MIGMRVLGVCVLAAVLLGACGARAGEGVELPAAQVYPDCERYGVVASRYAYLYESPSIISALAGVVRAGTVVSIEGLSTQEVLYLDSERWYQVTVQVRAYERAGTGADEGGSGASGGGAQERGWVFGTAIDRYCDLHQAEYASEIIKTDNSISGSGTETGGAAGL